MVCLCLVENTRVALLSVSPLVFFIDRAFVGPYMPQDSILVSPFGTGYGFI